MRFESVKAYAFGPLKGELNLAPRMNVVFGANEAGKSSWHGALYAGLCGMRRRKGHPGKDEVEFRERHQPWDSPEYWAAGSVIVLADGRKVELRHDLGSRLGGTAVDAEIAERDYSNEVQFEGAIDGSRWLGLNRHTFLSTACVRQGDIARVHSEANSLQADMQRAAATARADATAANALDILREFRREQVGSDRAPTKPLRRSQRRFEECTRDLVGVQQRHREYMERSADVERLEEQSRRMTELADAERAVLARQRADEGEKRLQHAQGLASLFPDGPPRRTPDQHEVLDTVTTALAAWDARPRVEELPGSSAEQLAQSIDDARRHVNALHAAFAENEAEDAERRAQHAVRLQEQLPDEVVPPGEDGALQRAREALAIWQSLDRNEVRDEKGGQGSRRTSIGFKGPYPRVASVVLGFVVAASVVVGSIVVFDSKLAGVIAFAAVLGLVMARHLAGRTSERDAAGARGDMLSDTTLEKLDSVCSYLGIDADEPNRQAVLLREWINDREREEKNLSDCRDELQRLRGDRSVDELCAEARNMRRRADNLVESASG